MRKRQEPGRVIRAGTINHGVEARDLVDNIQVAAPLEIARGSGGILIRLAAMVLQIRPGVTSGSISAGSYSAPTTGTVTLLKWTGSAWSTSGMPNVTAYNCFTGGSAALGIASGKFCWIVRLVGNWFILDADCS